MLNKNINNERVERQESAIPVDTLVRDIDLYVHGAETVEDRELYGQQILDDLKKIFYGKTIREDIFRDPFNVSTTDAVFDRLPFYIDTYANYKKYAEEAAKDGSLMKEDEDFYGWSILLLMKDVFVGKTKEYIADKLSDVMCYIK